MNTAKKLKKSQTSALLIFTLTLVRLFSFSNDKQLGFSFARLDVFYSYKHTVQWILLLAFCALFTFVMYRFLDKCGDGAGILCAIAVTDPLFACLQVYPAVLLSGCFVLLFTLHVLREKPTVPTQVTLFLLSLTGGILVGKNVLSFVLPAFVLFAASQSRAFSYGKTAITGSLAAVFAVAGGFINKYLCNTSDAFGGFTAYLNEVADFAKEKSSVFALLLIPSLLFGILLFNEYLRTEKKKKTKGKQKTQPKNDRFPGAFAVLTLAAYLILVLVGIFHDTVVLHFANFFVPLAFPVLLYRGDEKAIQVTEKTNAFIREHPFILLTVFILTYYVLLRFVLDDTVYRRILSFYVVGG